MLKGKLMDTARKNQQLNFKLAFIYFLIVMLFIALIIML
jgi:hypothetical protein